MFVHKIVRRAGVRPVVEVLTSTPQENGSVYVKTGRCGERHVAFVFFADECETVRLRCPMGVFRGKARDLISGQLMRPTLTAGGEECDLVRTEWGLMILVQEL